MKRLLIVPGYFLFVCLLQFTFGSTELCIYLLKLGFRIGIILFILSICLTIRRAYLADKPKNPSARGPRPLLSRENVIAFIQKSKRGE